MTFNIKCFSSLIFLYVSSTHGEKALIKLVVRISLIITTTKESEMPKSIKNDNPPAKTAAEKAQEKRDADAKAKAAATARASAKHSRQPAKKKPTQRQVAIAKNIAIVMGKLKLLQGEPGRILVPDSAGRALVESYIKGCAFTYGPQLKQTGLIEFMFDFARLMYPPKTDILDGIDLDAFFAQGETYDGETHLHVYVQYQTFLMIVGRGLRGQERNDVEPTEASLHRTTSILARMLRHVETISCWQGVGMGTDFETGQPAEYLFDWPKEVSAINGTCFPFEANERSYNEEHYQARGTGWKKRPASEDSRPTVEDERIFNDSTGRYEQTQVEDYDATNEQDAANELTRRHNKNQRLLKSLRD